MDKYFVLFKRQPGQETDAYSVVTKTTLKTIPTRIIKFKKLIGNIEIIKKEQLKALVEEAGGIWYGN